MSTAPAPPLGIPAQTGVGGRRPWRGQDCNGSGHCAPLRAWRLRVVRAAGLHCEGTLDYRVALAGCHGGGVGQAGPGV